MVCICIVYYDSVVCGIFLKQGVVIWQVIVNVSFSLDVMWWIVSVWLEMCMSAVCCVLCVVCCAWFISKYSVVSIHTYIYIYIYIHGRVMDGGWIVWGGWKEKRGLHERGKYIYNQWIVTFWKLSAGKEGCLIFCWIDLRIYAWCCPEHTNCIENIQAWI